MDAKEKALGDLDRALCNFLNAADDEWTPSEWAAETKRNYDELCDAYQVAHDAGCFPERRG